MISIHQKVIRLEQGQVFSFIKEQVTHPEAALVVLESTGGCEQLAADCFSKAEFMVHVAHPNQVRAYAKAKGFLAKTDKIDARILEEYGKFIEFATIHLLPSALERRLNNLNARLI